MKKILFAVVALALVVSCGKKTSGAKKFQVSGTITNAPAATLYLEQVPMANMQPVLVDSVKLDKNGRYTLSAPEGEASVYNLRFEQAMYPVAAVINDAPAITLDASFTKENQQFPDKFEIKGSASSQQLKDFMLAFNKQLQSLFENEQKGDSLQQAKASDSVLAAVNARSVQIAGDLRQLLSSSLEKSNNPALTMILLGYYQSTANNTGNRMQGLTKEELQQIVNTTAEKNPGHKGLATIKEALEGIVGKMAPEIVMPDPDGKEVRLSSFRGKYVLVDFWASWCNPCRAENPNVVKAYNRFKDKNFTILGVSLDRPGQRDKWVKAIMDDHLTWTQVSDLKFWESPVVQLYKFDGIPYNVLIDPSGKIIAEALRGEALEKKLEEVLR